MVKLKSKNCISCDTELSPLSKEDLDKFLLELNNEWKIADGYLQKKFKFSNFNEGLNLTNKIGGLCEEENHHPVIQLSWGKVVVLLKTVKIDSLSINDFILAAKIDELYN